MSVEGTGKNQLERSYGSAVTLFFVKKSLMKKKTLSFD
jgi:hypothetical protein